ncbi:MAG: transketolase C-terminal domain-containing protein, partial [Flexibacteraceae bacterium]
YGSMCRVVQEAAEALAQYDISVEIVDVQTLLPFDLHHEIIKSVKKTNRVIFADEDVPGGATAFMLQKVLEEQKAFQWLDCPPVTITAKEHRPAYSSDGDYFSKPSADDIFDTCWNMMYDTDPQAYPPLY